MDNEWIATTESGTPRVIQAWNFAVKFFVAADERLNLDLTEVADKERENAARFYYATTLN